MGENGSENPALMKMSLPIYQIDKVAIEAFGQPVEMRDVNVSISRGISLDASGTGGKRLRFLRWRKDIVWVGNSGEEWAC